MKILDMGTIFIIAVACNIFIHQFSSLAYKSQPYETRSKNSMSTLVIGGIICIIASQLILFNTVETYSENVLASGIGLGGILALITALFMNWDKINGAIKFTVMCLLFGGLIYFVHKKYGKNEKIDLISTEKQ